MKSAIQNLLRETVGVFFAVWILNSSVRALGGEPAILDWASGVAYGLLFTGCLLIGRRLAVLLVPKETKRNEPDYYSEAIAEIQKESGRNKNRACVGPGLLDTRQS